MLTPNQTATEIHKLAAAIAVLDKAIDRLWPTLPLDAMKKLAAVAELETFTPELARRLRDIADDIQDEGDAGVGNGDAEDATIFA